MRRALVALAAVVLVASGCSGDPETDVVPSPGDPTVAVDTPDLVALKAQSGIEDCRPGTASSKLPALTLPCLGGGPSVDLSSLQGPMVVNLWGSFCGPCRTEMPVLGEFYDTYGDQVGVLGVDLLDTFPGKAIDQARKRGTTYPQLADPGGELLKEEAFARAGRGLPYLAFVDADGEVRGEHTGGVRSVDELSDLVSQYLGVDLA